MDRRAAEAFADRIVSRIVRSRGYCEACGVREGLTCAHGEKRRYRGTRWDLQNLFCLCWRCHELYERRPLLWIQWRMNTMSPMVYEQVRVQALTVTKVDPLDAAERAVQEHARARAA